MEPVDGRQLRQMLGRWTEGKCPFIPPDNLENDMPLSPVNDDASSVVDVVTYSSYDGPKINERAAAVSLGSVRDGRQDAVKKAPFDICRQRFLPSHPDLDLRVSFLRLPTFLLGSLSAVQITGDSKRFD